MDQPQCPCCQELPHTLRIDSSTDLEKILILAAEKVSSGSLNEITAAYLQLEPQGLLDEPEKGYIQAQQHLANMVERKFPMGWRVKRWDDFVDLYFQCSNCRAIFSLQVETYHGRGGAWEYIETRDMLFQAA